MFKSIIGYFRKNWKTYFLEFSLIAIALFTLLYRIVMALKYGKAFLSDASIIPLMANRILQNHEFPALYWGQKYMGVPEAYVMALLGSLRGQVTEFMASFVTLLFYALFAFITSYLLYRITKKFTTFSICFLLFAFGGQLVVPMAVGGYMVCLLLGSAMMLLGYIHIWEGKIADRNYYAFLGLLAGIGFWSHFLIVEFLIPLILFDIFLKKKKRMLIDYGKSLLYFLITFFVGSLPFWIHNIRNHFETFQYYSFNGGTDKIDAIRLIPVTINAFINEAFGPLVLNTSNISQPLSIMVAVIFVAAFFYGLYAIHFAKKVQDNRRGMLIFYSVFFISFLFYDISRYALVEKDVIIRYYIMMIFAIIPILAFFISFLFKYVPYIALFLLFLVISLYTPNLPPRYGINDSVDEILLYLNKQNIHACYWNYAYNYELVLRSMEKTICSPLLDSSVTDRYPEYTRIVQQSSNIAFIINDETLKTKFISSLNKFNLRYVRADVNGIAVFTDIDKSYYDNLLNDWRDE